MTHSVFPDASNLLIAFSLFDAASHFYTPHVSIDCNFSVKEVDNAQGHSGHGSC